MERERAFVGFSSENGKPTLRRISTAPSPDLLFGRKPTKIKGRPDSVEAHTPFDDILGAYLETLNGLLNSAPLIMLVLPAYANAVFDNEIVAPVEKSGKRMKSRTQNTVVYEVDGHVLPPVFMALDRIKSIVAFRELAPGMFLNALVAVYDGFLSRLLKHIFSSNSALIGADNKQLTFAEIEKLGSIAAAKEYIIEREVERILRGSHAESSDELKAYFNINLQDEFPQYLLFLDICARRNLFTHNNGIVSQGYIDFCRHNGISLGRARVGEPLKMSAQDLKGAIEIFYELGVELVQVLWRKFDKGTVRRADTALNDVAFNLIQRDQYKLAIRLLNFAISLRGTPPERVRLMNIVNLANAYRLDGDEAKAKETLAGQDWSATSIEFRVSVASILGEWDEVAVLMHEVGSRHANIGRAEYRNWPVFEKLRETTQFKKAYEEIFGEPFDEAQRELEVP